jgi:hypothetical protein
VPVTRRQNVEISYTEMASALDSFMIPRAQDEYLNPLEQAFFGRTVPPKRNAHFFSAAKSAVVIRLIAIDRIVLGFEQLSKDQYTFERAEKNGVPRVHIALAWLLQIHKLLRLYLRRPGTPAS